MTTRRWQSFALSFMVFVAALAMGSQARAARIPISFGVQDELRHLQDVKVVGPTGEALYLGHKLSHHWYLLPFGVKDDGYVLGVKGKTSYFLLDEQRTKELQGRGLIPDPLPPYELSFFDYLFGNLGWVPVAGFGVLGIWGYYATRRGKVAATHAQAALALHQQGALDQAIEQYDKAIALKPREPELLYTRALAYSQKGDNMRAISEFTQTIMCNPKHVSAFMQRGYANQANGDHKRAISDFTAASKLISGHALPLMARGAAELQLNNPDRCVVDCTKAIDLDPDLADAYRYRGRAFEMLGRQDAAATDLGKADELDAVAANAAALQSA